jgi:uncharacterized protein (DUF433 family)
MAEDVKHPYIVRTPGTCGGRARVDGTRIPVWIVVEKHLRGEAPEELLAAYPRLSLAALYDALSFYCDHQAEVDADREAHSEEAFARLREEWEKEHGPAPTPAR